MPATRARVAIARSMFGSGRDFRLTSARTASATASCPDFGAARRTRSNSRTARGSPVRYTKWPNPGHLLPRAAAVRPLRGEHTFRAAGRGQQRLARGTPRRAARRSSPPFRSRLPRTGRPAPTRRPGRPGWTRRARGRPAGPVRPTGRAAGRGAGPPLTQPGPQPVHDRVVRTRIVRDRIIRSGGGGRGGGGRGGGGRGGGGRGGGRGGGEAVHQAGDDVPAAASTAGGSSSSPQRSVAAIAGTITWNR